MCQVPANWRSCSNTINGPRASVVDEVRTFPAVLSRKVIGGILLDLDWLQNLVHGVSFSHFFGVESYGVVVYLRIRLEASRNAKFLEKFPGLNVVRVGYVCLK